MPMETRVAIGLVWREGHLLVGTRAADLSLAGYDEFPGGKCHDHEEFADAVVREVWEETGLNVTPTRLRRELTYAYPHGNLRLSFWDCVEQQENRTEALSPFRWVPVEELAGLRFPPANQPILNDLVASGKA